MFKRVKITKDNANNPGLKELYEKAFPEGKLLLMINLSNCLIYWAWTI